MRRVVPLILALMMGCAMVALRVGGAKPLDLLELRAFDYRLQQRGLEPPSADVVLVTVDDASLHELGRWPWSRSRVADLLARIDAGGPRVIGIDLVQAEPTASCDITALQGAGSDQYGCGKTNPLDRSMCWFPDVNLVSATEATNLVTFALQASFSNPEAILKQRQNATTPIPGASPAAGAPAPAPR